jgi:segregation and condensation protein A
MDVNASKPYEVKIESFQGPLDILLNLIEERKLDVTRISLAEVTNQFIKYVEAAAIPPGMVADFIAVAARLLLIKTKALLPFLVLSEEEEEELIDLELRLKVLQMFREKGKWLRKREKQLHISAGRDSFNFVSVAFYPPNNIAQADLHAAFKRIVEDFRVFFEKQHYAGATLGKVVSLEERIRDLMKEVEQAIDKSFRQILGDKKEKMEIIVTFLAMLQLIKDRLIEADQKDIFGEITLKKRADHEAHNTNPGT